jgi:DNA-binding Lrp family transcriptional regulator
VFLKKQSGEREVRNGLRLTKSDQQMPRAIVLVNADVGKETEVFKAIKQISEVTEVHTSYGTYDIIAIVNADTNEKLKGIITSRIRSIPSIRSTLSMPVVD